MDGAERTSPITNAWGKVPARRFAVEHVDVFLGREGQAFNHQAQLASRAGTLFATWSSGIRDEEESGQQMVMAHSRDGGRTWSEPATVAAARPGRFAPSVVVSSGLRVHGDALIAYSGEWGRWHAERDAAREAATAAHDHVALNVRTEARVSRDDGGSWSPPTPVMANMMNFMPPAPTRTGRLIFAGQLTYAITDDPAGLTGWRRIGIAGIPADYCDDWQSRVKGAQLLGMAHRFNEANFFQTDDGVIHMMLRNEGSTLMGVTESRDDGESWSRPVLTGFTNSVSRSHFGRLADGRWFCISCPSLPPPGAAPSTRTPRTPIVLALSDDGVVFDRHYVIGDEPQGAPRLPGYLKHGRYGYPYLHVMGDAGLVIYSRNKEDICVARFALADLASA